LPLRGAIPAPHTNNKILTESVHAGKRRRIELIDADQRLIAQPTS